MVALTNKQKEILSKYAALAADALRDELSGYWGEAFSELGLESKSLEGEEAMDYFYKIFVENA